MAAQGIAVSDPTLHVRLYFNYIDGPLFKAMRPAQLKVLLVMVRMMDWQTGIVEEKAARYIATMCGVRRRAVINSQNRLLLNGYLEKVKTGGGHAPTVWRVSKKGCAFFCTPDVSENTHQAHRKEHTGRVAKDTEKPSPPSSTNNQGEEEPLRGQNGAALPHGGGTASRAIEEIEISAAFLHSIGIHGLKNDGLSELLSLDELKTLWTSTAGDRRKAKKNPLGLYIRACERRWEEKVSKIGTPSPKHPPKALSQHTLQSTRTNSDDHGVVAPRIDASESPLDPSKISKIPQNRLTARAAAILSKPEWEQMP